MNITKFFFIIIFTLGIVGTGYFLATRYFLHDLGPTNDHLGGITPTPTPSDAVEWEAYSWQNMRFSYPSDWSIQPLLSGSNENNPLLLLFTGNESTGETTIYIDSSQRTCKKLKNTTCQPIGTSVIYTYSSDPDLIFIYQQIYESIIVDPTPKAKISPTPTVIPTS